MRFKGFIGPTYRHQSKNVDCQRAINLIPQVNESGSSKEAEVISFISAPGLATLLTIGEDPVRAAYTSKSGAGFLVAKNKLYAVANDFTYTEIGTLSTETGRVGFADNGIHMVLVDGLKGYVWTFESEEFAEITAEGFTERNPPTQVSYIDGYFIFEDAGTDNFFISGLDDVTFDPLDVSDADGSPDKIVAHISKERELWLLGEFTTEVWFNSGDADFPFSRVSGAFIETGCGAKWSIAKIGSALFWLGRDEKGYSGIFMAEGYQPRKISTHSVDQIIQRYETLSDAEAFTYHHDGHSYYVLTFPTADASWCYDLTTGLWHERLSFKNGQFHRHRASCYANMYGKHVVGDFENGRLHELSALVYSDAGDVLARERVAPHISAGDRRIFYSRFILDMETGVGLDGIGQGTDPQAMLQYSDDSGHSWGNELWSPIGKIGERSHTVEWRRLGKSKDRVFRIRITDPIPVTLIGADLDFATGGL